MAHAHVQGKVAVMGHSYVNRLQVLVGTDADYQSNLGLEGVQVRFWSRPGARVFDLLQMVDQMFGVGYRPNCVVLQIGDNDLDYKSFDMQEFLGMLRCVINKLEKAGVEKIIIMKVFPRTKLRYVTPVIYEEMRGVLNTLLSSEYSSGARSCIGERRLYTPGLLDDGVHLCSIGMRRYYHAIQWAIIRALRK